MSKEVLATCTCEGCGATANIKKRANSKNLYLHCPDCGLDQRSGAAIQAKWQALVSGQPAPEQSEAEPTKAEQETEWKPTIDTHRTSEKEPEPEAKSGNVGKWIVGGFLAAVSLGCMFAGVRVTK